MSETRAKPQGSTKEGLYIALISVHGLVRGYDLELGRDADTGGQIQYVVELARALARSPKVARVDLITRRVLDPKVSADYAEPLERLADNAFIVRVPAGPRRYLRKEVLWPHLDALADETLLHFRSVGRTPDFIHSHYADAGYVGVRLSQLLGVPLIHTGHSLGVDKRQRLLERGTRAESIEKQYNMSTRIEAEEIVLGNAALVVASTTQEVAEQYQRYDNYHPQRMKVIPPGVNLERFHPPRRFDQNSAYKAEIARFLSDPDKPMVLALSRADERKNIATLIHAFARTEGLRERANLVVIAGNRDDLSKMPKGQRRVLTEVLRLIDYYDLYGSAAFPKHHTPEDVPELYRLATRAQGVFVNPALTEPFGLTLIEAAASGLPIVATENGGPQDIIANCENGVLINPHDAEAMGQAILRAVVDRTLWRRWSRNGIRGAKQHYTWDGHVQKYLREVQRVLSKARRPRRRTTTESGAHRLPMMDRLIFCDIDNTLIGDREALQELFDLIHGSAGTVGFGIATGRRIESAMKVIREWDIPMPDVIVSSVGSEIHYGNNMVEDTGWRQHIDYAWRPEALRAAMHELPGLKLQPSRDQRRFKISYFLDPEQAPSFANIRGHLRRLDLHCKLIYSHESYLDLLPLRASKGLAIRYLMMKWGLAPDHILVAGDSGNDVEMLRGDTLGVVVGNYSPELKGLHGEPRIYFAHGHYAAGIIEGVAHYDFLGALNFGETEGAEAPVEESIA